MKRNVAIRKRNAARREKEFARAFGSIGRCVFVTSLPCSVTGCYRRPSENCHAVGGGASRKADADRILPLCHFHHLEQHRIGSVTFSNRHGINLLACADRTEELWRQAGDFAD